MPSLVKASPVIYPCHSQHSRVIHLSNNEIHCVLILGVNVVQPRSIVGPEEVFIGSKHSGNVISIRAVDECRWTREWKTSVACLLTLACDRPFEMFISGFQSMSPVSLERSSPIPRQTSRIAKTQKTYLSVIQNINRVPHPVPIPRSRKNTRDSHS